MNSKEYLEHFKARWEAPPTTDFQHTAELWDERAVEWDSGLRNDQVTQYVTKGRIDAAVRFLKACGALEPEFTVIDIGCGPGRFVTEFSKHVRRAEGTDFSAAMLAFGETFAAEEGRANVAFTQCDFLHGDIEPLGWKGRFDLVYSSMTPAVSAFSSLEKMVEMSRAFCCNSSCIIGRSTIQDEIAKALGTERVRPFWDGSWFYTLLNLVWNMGYFPQTDYYTLSYAEERTVTREMVDSILGRMLHSHTARPEDSDRAYDALMAVSHDGVVLEECTNWYGAIAWDVRKKTQRW